MQPEDLIRMWSYAYWLANHNDTPAAFLSNRL